MPSVAIAERLANHFRISTGNPLAIGRGSFTLCAEVVG